MYCKISLPVRFPTSFLGISVQFLREVIVKKTNLTFFLVMVLPDYKLLAISLPFFIGAVTMAR